MKEILLHCCCAPCSSAILEWMLNNDVRPTLYYCNPNIYPEEEYMIRKNELTRYASELGLRVIDDDHEPEWEGWDKYHESWRKVVCGLENEPERGKRCLECFKLRMLQTARVAKREGIASFTTTLASSRWKSLDQINEAGRWAAEKLREERGELREESLERRDGNGELRITFDERNWRKGGLQQRRNELLNENGFYNQLYCGCEFSLKAMTAKFPDLKEKITSCQSDALL